jgi:16S rRNA (uracil1498-N3)-methyltransferase
MPVFFIQSTQIKDQTIQITGELAHHLRNVLRIRTGETLDVVDENRRRYHITLSDRTPHQLLGHIQAIEEPRDVPLLEITLAQALLKSPKMDWVVQKATELGAGAILPIVTERTVRRPRKEREPHQQERWQTIAKEAAQQCGRADIPEVMVSVSLDELCEKPLDAIHKLVLWEQEQDMTLKSVLADLKERVGFQTPPYESGAILAGPEGGFSPLEIDKIQKAGWIPVTMGRRILRSETASLAALAILQYELGDMRS